MMAGRTGRCNYFQSAFLARLGLLVGFRLQYRQSAFDDAPARQLGDAVQVWQLPQELGCEQVAFLFHQPFDDVAGEHSRVGRVRGHALCPHDVFQPGFG